jgi:hypothetical protein
MQGKLQVTDPQLQQWINNAAPEDIEIALQVGWRNIPYFRSAVKPSIIYTQTGISAVPVEKGQIGEEFVESILREAFSDLQNTTKTPRSGDITLWSAGRKVVVEVKNYSNPVPTSGVEKFRRDLSTNGAFAGVFISMQSPIAGVTNDFKLTLESVDGRTVPTAYIVSTDRAQIVTSVNMVLYFACTIINTVRDSYSRDVILGTVRSMSAHIDELARSRSSIQREIAGAAELAIKNASSIMAAEVKLRSDVEKLQEDLCEVTFIGSRDEDLRKITWYEGLQDGMKTSVAKIISAISGDAPFSGAWKISAKKCTHSSGNALIYSAKKVQVSIPNNVDLQLVGSLITLLGSKYSYSGGHLVDICDETYDIILSLINGSFQK